MAKRERRLPLPATCDSFVEAEGQIKASMRTRRRLAKICSTMTGSAAAANGCDPASRFAIVGSGSMETVLREAIVRLDLGGCVSLLPFTTDIPLAMSALDVLVHPAVGTEALSLVILEALASGRPIIASRLDGIPETFNEGKHGLLVPADNVPALAGAMRTLLASPKLRERFGAAGPRHVREKFSRMAMAGRIRQLYQQICAPA